MLTCVPGVPTRLALLHVPTRLRYWNAPRCSRFSYGSEHGSTIRRNLRRISPLSFSQDWIQGSWRKAIAASIKPDASPFPESPTRSGTTVTSYSSSLYLQFSRERKIRGKKNCVVCFGLKAPTRAESGVVAEALYPLDWIMLKRGIACTLISSCARYSSNVWGKGQFRLQSMVEKVAPSGKSLKYLRLELWSGRDQACSSEFGLPSSLPLFSKGWTSAKGMYIRYDRYKPSRLEDVSATCFIPLLSLRLGVACVG